MVEYISSFLSFNIMHCHCENVRFFQGSREGMSSPPLKKHFPREKNMHSRPEGHLCPRGHLSPSTHGKSTRCNKCQLVKETLGYVSHFSSLLDKVLSWRLSAESRTALDSGYSHARTGNYPVINLSVSWIPNSTTRSRH